MRMASGATTPSKPSRPIIVIPSATIPARMNPTPWTTTPRTSQIHPVSQLQRLVSRRRWDVHRTPRTSVTRCSSSRIRAFAASFAWTRRPRRTRPRTAVAASPAASRMRAAVRCVAPPAPAPRRRRAQPGRLAERRNEPLPRLADLGASTGSLSASRWPSWRVGGRRRGRSVPGAAGSAGGVARFTVRVAPFGQSQPPSVIRPAWSCPSCVGRRSTA